MQNSSPSALSKNEILKRLREHKAELQTKFPISGIFLFGSYAREEETLESDVDIMVDIKTPMGWDIVDVLEFFERIIPEKKIDMITKNGLKNSHYSTYIEKDLIHV